MSEYTQEEAADMAARIYADLSGHDPRDIRVKALRARVLAELRLREGPDQDPPRCHEEPDHCPTWGSHCRCDVEP